MKLLTTPKNNVKTLILRSNIKTPEDVAKVARSFNQRKNILKWSIDLDDWEKVLKVQTVHPVGYEMVQHWIEMLGYKCSELNH